MARAISMPARSVPRISLRIWRIARLFGRRLAQALRDDRFDGRGSRRKARRHPVILYRLQKRAHLRAFLHAARDQIAARHSQPRAFPALRSEEHTSELPSLMRISYAVFCLKKK